MAAKQGKTLSSNTMNLKFMKRKPAASPAASAPAEDPFPAQSTSKQVSKIRHEASYSAFPCLLIAYPRQSGSTTEEQSGRKSFGQSKGKAKETEQDEQVKAESNEEDEDSSDDVSTTLRGEAKRKRELNPAAARTIKHHLPSGYAKPKGFEDVKTNKEFADGQIAEARAKRMKKSKEGMAID